MVIGGGYEFGLSAGLDVAIDKKGIAAVALNLGAGVSIPFDAKAYGAMAFLIPLRNGFSTTKATNFIRNFKIRVRRR